MNETLQVGDVFPIQSFEVLKAEGLQYWEQRVSTPVGIFLYDFENTLRDGHTRWISEDGRTAVTTYNGNNTITEVNQR